MTWRWTAGLLLIFGMTQSALGDQLAGQQIFDRQISGLLGRYCGDCHSDQSSDDKWAFDRYSRYEDLVADQSSWRKVQLAITHHTMPPLGEDSPSNAERKSIVDWIEETVFYVDPLRPDPGPVHVRRMNRAEYRNSVRDTFGIQFDPTTRFPADDSGYGFDNIGEVLSFSPLHYEKYRAAAKEIAGTVTSIGPPPRVGIEMNADKIPILSGHAQLRDNRIWLTSDQDGIGTSLFIPVTSDYRVLVRAASVRDASGTIRPFRVLCDGVPVGELSTASEYQGKPGAQGTAFTLVQLPQGEHRITVALNPSPQDDDSSSEGDSSSEDDSASEDAAPFLGTVGFMSISGPFTPTAPTVSSFLQPYLGNRAADVPGLRLSGEDLDQGSGRNSLDTGRAWFSTNGYRHAPVLLNRSGEYRLRFKVGAQQVGDEPVKFEVRLGDTSLGTFEVTAQSQAEQWIETTRHLEAGLHDWQVWFVNEFVDPDTKAERWFWLHEFTVEGPLGGDYGISATVATDALQGAARRLFRRPLSADESKSLEQFVLDAIDTGLLPPAALRFGLETLLISPTFLYHPLPKPDGDPHDGTAAVDEFALASRLSYFLWSTLPDDQLMALAQQGKLREQWDAQVDRMLADPKSAALTANFAGQWLQLRNMDIVRPDRGAFPDFDADLADDMRRETELVFETILKENRGVLEFLNADYTFLNERLARHYGMAEPADEGFVRVSLKDDRRRGVITHGSVLTMTSLPTRTSPVKRGKWVLEQFFGVEPPPQPADVPALPPQKEDDTLSLRQRLQQHSSDARCAACHALLDPIGFALENYDAIGRWRASESGRSIDASGKLVGGADFDNWVSLRSQLADDQSDAFVKSFVEQLLTYALGRGITYRDKPAIQAIIDESASSGHGFQDVIRAICKSVPFQRMRHGDGETIIGPVNHVR